MGSDIAIRKVEEEFEYCPYYIILFLLKKRASIPPSGGCSLALKKRVVDLMLEWAQSRLFEVIFRSNKTSLGLSQLLLGK